MRCGSIVLISIILLAALGFGVYSVRSDALKARQLQLEAQLRRNSALEQETVRLQAFVDSPMCAGVVKP